MPAGLYRDRPQRGLADGPQIMARTTGENLIFWTSRMPLADGSVCKYANFDVGLAALRGFRCICRFHGLSDLVLRRQEEGPRRHAETANEGDAPFDAGVLR